MVYMKKINTQIKLIAALFSVVSVVACSKSFLDKPPIGTLGPNIVASEAGVNGLLIGAYSLVDGEGAAGDGFAAGASNWIFGGVTSDDAYKGSDPTDVGDAAPMEQWGDKLQPTNGAIPQKWNVNYAAIQRCNDVINTANATTTLSADKKKLIIAQARFLRAYFHMDLKKIFGNIIYADEKVNPQNTDVTNTADAWVGINADLLAAANDLPATFPEVGRANKWAAKALQAKAFMFQNKLSTAYPILKEIIASGTTTGGVKYALNTNYFSNFNPAQKNSAESVFAAQTSVQDGSSVDWGGSPNGNYGDILNFPYTGGPGACCGFYNPSQDLANAFKTDANGLPVANYYEGNHVSSQYGAKYTGNIDPRIDWTMGRPGIPYLDWGKHPGVDWIRNPVNDGVLSPLKNVYAASQKGAFTDVGSAYWGPTELVANNVNIIRFADVILWAAECAADANELANATDYVNQIRTRAKNSSRVTVKANGDPADYNAATAQYAAGNDADNYKIGTYATFSDKATAVDAVRLERRLELAMEGHRFFDLVRWGIAATTINTYIARETELVAGSERRPLKKGAVFKAGQHEIMPIPQAAMDNLNQGGKKRLTQNKGYTGA